MVFEEREPVGTANSSPEIRNSQDDVDNEKTNLKEARPPQFRNTTEECVAVFLLALAPAVTNVSTGALQISLPWVGKDFGITDGSLSWTIDAFTLGCGAFLLFMGGLADRFGRKRSLFLSYLCYAIFSLISGFIPSFEGFCVLRALQGVASAAGPPAGVGILGSTYSPSLRKNKVMATFAGGAPVGYTLGIVAGGVCCQFLSWRSSMFFFAIVYGIAAVGVWFFVPEDVLVDNRSIKEKLATMDYGGIALATIGLVFLVFSLTQANSTSTGWKTPYIIVLLVIGIILLVAFCVYENYVPANPLMPMSIWKYQGFALCMLINSLGWMAFNGITVYYCALYFQKVHDNSPILTTAYLSPFPIAGATVNLIAAFILHKVSGRILLMIGMLGYLACALLWAFMPYDVSYWAMAFPSMICGVLGADLGYNVGNMHTLNTVPPNLQSSAGGVFNTNLQISITIGLAASSAIVSSKVPNQDTVSSKELLDGYHAGLYLAVGLAGLALLISPFMRVGTQGGDEKKKGKTSEVSSETVIPEEKV